jgi:hypothetical protein
MEEAWDRMSEEERERIIRGKHVSDSLPDRPRRVGESWVGYRVKQAGALVGYWVLGLLFLVVVFVLSLFVGPLDGINR